MGANEIINQLKEIRNQNQDLLKIDFPDSLKYDSNFNALYRGLSFLDKQLELVINSLIILKDTGENNLH
jgi:hypothetical protein